MFEIKKNDQFSYLKLQKQLDDEHRNLMKQRQKILGKQSQKLQLYQKIDLVQFFNFQQNQQEQTKEQIMYHLTSKFKNYMKKLTQNNVYKRMGHLVGQNQCREGSKSKLNSRSNSRSKSKVQRNGELGRLFQRMRYYEQLYKDQNDLTIKQESPEGLKFRTKTESDKNSRVPTNYLPVSNSTLDKGNLNKQKGHCDNKGKTSEQLQINTLHHSLQQQQKILLFSQLNHYIKLYKESQVKQRFMSQHMENLYEYFIEVQMRNKSKVRNRYLQMTNNQNSTRQIVNSMLSKQVMTYRQEIKELDDFYTENIYETHQSRLSSDQSKPKCREIKKIDRFKQFAQQVNLMQRQLENLAMQLNYNRNLGNRYVDSEQTHSHIDQKNSQKRIQSLVLRINQLQSTIASQQQKKLAFFQQVKKFKLVMQQKQDQIEFLRRKLSKHEQVAEKVRYQQQQAVLGRSTQPKRTPKHKFQTFENPFQIPQFSFHQSRVGTQSQLKAQSTQPSTKPYNRQTEHPYDKINLHHYGLQSDIKGHTDCGDYMQRYSLSDRRSIVLPSASLVQLSGKRLQYSRVTTKQASERSQGHQALASDKFANTQFYKYPRQSRFFDSAYTSRHYDSKPREKSKTQHHQFQIPQNSENKRRNEHERQTNYSHQQSSSASRKSRINKQNQLYSRITQKSHQKSKNYHGNG